MSHRRRYAIIVLAVVVLIAGALWLLRREPDESAKVSIAFVMTNSAPQEATFRVRNDSPVAIFLSWMVVETNTGTAWNVVKRQEPKDPRVVDPGKFMDLTVTVPPAGRRWRLKVIYGTQTKGPGLLLTKIELGIANRSVKGLNSVGVFTGQKTATIEMVQ